MADKFKRSIFIFRRDLRLIDNQALNIALNNSAEVLPIFIFDPRQLKDNPYKGNNLIQFMLESLQDLDEELKRLNGKLYCFSGEAESIISELLDLKLFDAVYFNLDYTPFARERDAKIDAVCKSKSIACITSHDALINPPGSVLKADGKPYTIFTPFFKVANKLPVAKPNTSKAIQFYNKPIEFAEDLTHIKILPEKNSQIYTHGGRKDALKKLKSLSQLVNYKAVRDFPGIKGTSGLSAHNKFGTISVRELFYAVHKLFGSEHTLIQELYWRDFFTHIGFHFPHVFTGCFHKKYDRIAWENNQDKFLAWCQGRTGFPIVDAGMRELNTTGFMHNRVRMVTASFLVKDLHIDWHWGERYFANKLVDYDAAVNNGNWQWAASTGCDAQPYFRVFNPWRQQERFDPECIYIKKWVPELKSLTSKEIARLEKVPNPLIYPPPIVDHREAKNVAEDLYREIS